MFCSDDTHALLLTSLFWTVHEADKNERSLIPALTDHRACVSVSVASSAVPWGRTEGGSYLDKLFTLIKEGHPWLIFVLCRQTPI
jgi:hypothetical protein